MAQRRDPPAYQEYAASMMARTEYRLASLEARGLLWTIRNECWVNGCVPADPVKLAKVLGVTEDEIRRALPQVSTFIKTENGVIRCPDLDDYRNHLDDRRQRQSEGGRIGAARTNATRKPEQVGKTTGRPRLPRESLVQNSQAKNSQRQAIEGSAVRDEWINDYDRASNGH